MKKLLYCAAALALGIFAGSCQRENLEPVATGGVTYTITLPEAVQTKGQSGYAEYDLYLEVYKTVNAAELEEATLLFEKKEVITAEMNGKISVGLDLLNDQDYTVLFWANKKDVDYFDLGDLRKVTVKTAVSNNNDRDAFCGKDQIAHHDGTKSKTVTLKRPFAQLNIATIVTTTAGYAVTPENSKVTVYGAPVTYNVFDGAVSGETTIEYDWNKVPADKKVNDTYDLVAMNYVLVPEGTVDVEYWIETVNGTVNNTVNNVPVKVNYRTNIIGNLLTSDATYTVEIKPGFDTPAETVESWNGSEISEPQVSEENENIYEIEYPSELAWLAAAVNGTLPEDTRAANDPQDFAGKTFVLTSDIDLAGQEWSPIGTSSNIFKGTFDGNRHTVKNLKITGNKSNVGLFGVTHNGHIKNLVVENAEVSGRLNVGVVAGNPYTSKYSDITVKGHIEVNGMAYVGAVGGKDAYADWTNIKVEADETSYVKANSVENGKAYRTYVGGVVGFNGEGGHKFSNITSNINVEGSTCDVGGLFGIAHYGNQFEKCVCTGNVTITTGEVENALEMGGIAGVWNNGGEDVVFTNCTFSGELSTPNIEEEVNFYYGGLVGNPYSATGNGKLIIDGFQYVASAAELEAAANAATSETTIKIGYDIDGDVTVIQKQGVKVTIDGNGKKYDGTIKIHSNSEHYADAALTIQNVNFESSKTYIGEDGKPYFNFIEALEKGSARYSTNITVENCTFKAIEASENIAVGVQIKSSKNAQVIDCTATNMHSLLQAQSCDESVLVQNCTINGKNGVAFKQVKAATVEGTTITATAYGIRFDGNTDNYGITVKDNNVTAVQPLIVRKMTGKDNTIALEGTNTLNTDAEYQIVITNGSDDEEYVKPTGTYTLTGADRFNLFPAVPVAKIGNTEYTSIDEAIANWGHNTTLTLIANVTLNGVITLKSTEYHILDLGTYTMTAAKGKDAISITAEDRTSASYALDIKADATNPGGITATSKAVVKTTGKSGVKDRPIIRFYNGVYNASNVISHSGSNGTNCPQFQFHGGVYNANLSANRALIQIYGGTFNGKFYISVDSSAYALISGGKFKYLDNLYGSALNSDKFTIGSSKGNFDRGVYVDDEGYIVVGGAVITEFGDKFAAKATNASKAGSYLPYSSAATYGLYYTNATAAIEKHGEANVVLK